MGGRIEEGEVGNGQRGVTTDVIPRQRVCIGCITRQGEGSFLPEWVVES